MDGFRALWQRTRERLALAAASPISAERNPAVAAYLDEVLTTFPYTDTAKAWFRGAISFEVEKPIDPEKFNAWIGLLLQERGPDLLRTKGVLSYANDDRRFAFQAVHMMADGDFIGPWKEGEQRVSRLVFIGRNLNRPQLRRGFESCTVD